MRIESFASLAGAMLIAGAGVAQAGEPFAALSGVLAAEMTPSELGGVRGESVSVEITNLLSDRPPVEVVVTRAPLTLVIAVLPPNPIFPVLEILPPNPI